MLGTRGYLRARTKNLENIFWFDSLTIGNVLVVLAMSYLLLHWCSPPPLYIVDVVPATLS